MFNLSGSEIVFLIIIALVVLGPDKLPDAMRKAGKAYGDFKRMTTGFQSEMRSVLDEPMRELRETAELAKKSASFDTSSITKPLSGIMSPATPNRSTPSAPVASGAMPVRKAEADKPPADVVPGVEASAPPFAAAAPVGTPDTAPVAPAASAAGSGTVSQEMDATSRRLARMRAIANGNGATTPPADGSGE